MLQIKTWIALPLLMIALAHLHGAKSALNTSASNEAAAWKGDVYTLDVCVVSGEKLGSMGEPVVKSYDGREVRFCCESCIKKFEADKDKYIKRIDELLIEQQMPHYPMTMCLVMPDDKLEGGHEESVKMIYRNRLVRFCCPDCVKDFKADPDQYVAKLDAAVIEQQKDKYPLTTCPISGEKLGGMGEPVNYVVGTMLVKFCCENCIKKFEKDPLPTMVKVHEAWMAAHKDGGHGDAPAAPAGKPDDHKDDGHDHGS